ncbi:hypothetical protein [Adonisia turfae]|nr:hypothetical protein [Adonisia turfae]
MTYKFGDVVLVPFPFTNQVTSKKRPAVIVIQMGIISGTSILS